MLATDVVSPCVRGDFAHGYSSDGFTRLMTCSLTYSRVNGQAGLSPKFIQLLMGSSSLLAMFLAPFDILLGPSVVSAWGDSQIARAGEGAEPPDRLTYPRIPPHLLGEDGPHYPFPFGKTEPEVLMISITTATNSAKRLDQSACSLAKRSRRSLAQFQAATSQETGFHFSKMDHCASRFDIGNMFEFYS